MRILIRMTAGLSPFLAPLARRRLEFARAADRAARVVARAVQTLTDWRPLERGC